MGFLSDPGASVADFSKAVISLWFRVPQASLDAAAAAWNDFLNGDSSASPWVGSIPLVTFGWQGDGHSAAFFSGSSTSFGIAPSYIGVFAGGVDPDTGNPVPCLYARLQYSHGGTQDDGTNNGLIAPDAFEVGANNYAGYTTLRSSAGHILAPAPIRVAADKWHHALISFDVSAGSSVAYDDSGVMTASAASKFWWAFDDVDYNGDAIGPHGVYAMTGAGGLNDIVSLFSGQPIVQAGYDAFGAETFTTIGTDEFAGGALPVAGFPFGVPSTAANSGAILKVEMAEFQMFTGVTLDTSITAHRRAFINADGKPVPPKYSRATDGTISADPASPPVTLLGKLPDVALCQSSGNWIGGKNMGSATTHFAKTGTVKSFTPDPKLGV